MPKGSQTKEGKEIIDFAKNSGIEWDIKDLEQHLDRTNPQNFRSAYEFFKRMKRSPNTVRNYMNSILSGDVDASGLLNDSVQSFIESSTPAEEIVGSVLKESFSYQPTEDIEPQNTKKRLASAVKASGDLHRKLKDIIKKHGGMDSVIGTATMNGKTGEVHQLNGVLIVDLKSDIYIEKDYDEFEIELLGR